MKNKNYFSRYVDYLKDNPQGYWFKSKIFGYGWTPATWQGWLVTFIFLAYIFFLGIGLSRGEPTNQELVHFFMKLVISIMLIVIICILKGEKPRWRWGFD